MLKLRMVERNILDHYTDLPVGEVLRRARIQFDLEVPMVASRLNIRPEHIAAIEAGDVGSLPGRVYAIGFVRAYANFLQLDSDKIVYLFKSQCIGHAANRDLNFPIPVTETRSPAWWMVAASVGTLAIIGMLFFFLGGSKTPDAEPAVPEAVGEIRPEAKKDAEGKMEEEKTVAAPDKTEGRLKVTALESSWVEVRAGDTADNILISRVLKKGESFTAPDVENLSLSTGNAEGVKVFWDGKAVDVFEGRKGIVRDLPVSGLSAYKAKAAE